MNKRAILAVVRKDLKVVTQSKSVMIPLIIVPVIMLVLLPGLVALVPLLDAQFGASEMQDMQAFLANMPPSLTILLRSVRLFHAPLYAIRIKGAEGILPLRAGEKGPLSLEFAISTIRPS